MESIFAKTAAVFVLAALATFVVMDVYQREGQLRFDTNVHAALISDVLADIERLDGALEAQRIVLTEAVTLSGRRHAVSEDALLQITDALGRIRTEAQDVRSHFVSMQAEAEPEPVAVGLICDCDCDALRAEIDQIKSDLDAIRREIAAPVAEVTTSYPAVASYGYGSAGSYGSAGAGALSRASASYPPSRSAPRWRNNDGRTLAAHATQVHGFPAMPAAQLYEAHDSWHDIHGGPAPVMPTAQGGVPAANCPGGVCPLPNTGTGTVRGAVRRSGGLLGFGVVGRRW